MSPKSHILSKDTAIFWTAVLAISLQTTGHGQIEPSLADLSLEQLMNETVTSVSKKEQKRSDAAAAISVLSNDDIRRSGATTVADALRLVPGVNVAAVNASQMAISARGFNNLYANKLLVLVDGRAVYSPLFGGVFWDLQQTMMNDVDRIEVIRGPGATLWGANAVNGVINVVTRSARDTQGGLIFGGGGDMVETTAGIRYGGTVGEQTYYRVFADEQSYSDYPLANGQPTGDAWSTRRGGFRLDHYPDADTHLTWQADTTTTDVFDHTADAYNINTIGRWDRALSDRSVIEVQAYFDRTGWNEPTLADTVADTIDVTLQHSFGIGQRNDVIWGLGYRYIVGSVTNPSSGVILRNADFSQQLFSAFIQDEIKLLPDRFTLSFGTKLEHNDYTGFEVQPSISTIFKPTKQQVLWASVSRAVRTPTVLEGKDVVAPLFGAPFVGPGEGLYVPALVGNPNAKSETLLAYELGWRMQLNPRVNVDVAGFYNDYKNVIAPATVPQFVPGEPVGTAELPWENNLSGNTYGGDISVTISPLDTWRLTGAYSLLMAQLHGPAIYAQSYQKGTPQHQITLRSAYDFNPSCSFDGQLRYVGSIQGVKAYLTADLRVSYRPTERLELSLVTQNLLDSQHQEQTETFQAVTSEVPRSFYGKITWRF